MKITRKDVGFRKYGRTAQLDVIIILGLLFDRPVVCEEIKTEMESSVDLANKLQNPVADLISSFAA